MVFSNPSEALGLDPQIRFSSSWSMIFPENRYPLFRIML